MLFAALFHVTYWGVVNKMKRKELIRIGKTVAALACAVSLLSCSTVVSADDMIDYDDSYSDFDDDGSYVDSGYDADDGGSLFEDTGDDVQYNAGVPMDTLQDAMESGNTKVLEKIASLGALTGKNSTGRPGTGIGGSGAYRGDEDEEEDDEEYYDLQLDEGDADEVETEPFSESPGRLIAASPDRIQEYLDSMSEVDSPTGSDGELTVAAYIESRLGSMGYTVQEQAFHEGVLNEDGVDAPGVNVLAERGANSRNNRKRDIVLIVTHFDSKRSPSEDDPFANDKSGAAALMETARILSEVVTDTDICFLFLSGEEDGGYGAQNFIASLSDENRSRITGVLSVERVGYDSDTPYVLKTLTGEPNSLGNMVQQLGLNNDLLTARLEESDYDDDDDGTWVEVGQSSDGYIDERTAEQIAAAQAGELSDDGALEIDTADYLDEEEDSDEGSEAIQVPMPEAWSYLKGSTPTMNSFANASIHSVTLSQYMPALDSASFEETIALGLAEAPDQTSADAGADGVVELEASNLTGAADELVDPENALTPEGSAEEGADLPGSDVNFVPSDYPVVDAELVADTANVVAATLAKIMDPAS